MYYISKIKNIISVMREKKAELYNKELSLIPY